MEQNFNKKQLGAAFLLAGTAIGSGMISLPMVLAKFGITSTVVIMFVFAVFTYFTALIRSTSSASLKEVGELFGCQWAGHLGDLSLKLLSLALLAAYIFGASSIINAFWGNIFPISLTVILFSSIITLIFFGASNIIIHLNKFLFITMFGVLLALVVVLFFQTPIHLIPQNTGSTTMKDWATLVPIIFTSFGFQGSIHSMTKFSSSVFAIMTEKW